MLKRDEISNLTSCLNKSSDDEPLFVLCARDPLAPEVVRMWAKMYEQSGGRLDKSAEAWVCASRMVAWHARNNLKLLPEDPRLVAVRKYASDAKNVSDALGASQVESSRAVSMVLQRVLMLLDGGA